MGMAACSGHRSSPPVRMMSRSPDARSTSSHARYAWSVSSTYHGVWYERRMILEWSSEAPLECPSSNCSSPTTSPGARRDSQYAAALPIAPSPSTAYVNSLRGGAPVTSRRLDRVPVVLEGRQRAAVVDPPLPLLDGQLPERLCHGLHVRRDRTAARADVVHAHGISLDRVRRHGLPRQLQRIEREREFGQRREVRRLRTGPVPHRLTGDEPRDGAAHLLGERERLLRPPEAVDPHDVGSRIRELL